MDALDSVLRSLPVEAKSLEARLHTYGDLLAFYNRRLNLVSREDVRYLRNHHLAHCLALASRRFAEGSVVIDWGTGGGLPLLPLALVYPEVSFIGVDAVEKKLQAVRQMARALELENVDVWHGRAEEFSVAHTHSVSRATAPLETLWGWHSRNATSAEEQEDHWNPGLICLKGGDLRAEIASMRPHEVHVQTAPIEINDAYFADKYVVSVCRLDMCTERN